MKRFFLHVVTNIRHTEDMDGYLFRDLDTAKSEAVASVREVAASLTRSGVNPADLRIEICNEERQLLTVVSLDDVLNLKSVFT